MTTSLPTSSKRTAHSARSSATALLSCSTFPRSSSSVIGCSATYLRIPVHLLRSRSIRFLTSSRICSFVLAISISPYLSQHKTHTRHSDHTYIIQQSTQYCKRLKAIYTHPHGKQQKQPSYRIEKPDVLKKPISQKRLVGLVFSIKINHHLHPYALLHPKQNPHKDT